jgi:hypothetical protein
MLDKLDWHVDNRLNAILFQGASITVCPYIPERDKGEVTYPSIAFKRLSVAIDIARARPNVEIFVPSDAKGTVVVPPSMGEPSQISGPLSWTRKPYPTPVIVKYEIQTLATDKQHADYLTAMIFQAIPVGYQPEIDDQYGAQYPLFMYGKPINMDDLSLPEFRTAFIVTVSDVWLDRLEQFTHTSIQKLDFDLTAE